MTNHTEWADFFNGHAPDYDENEFTRNTVVEVDFLIEALGLSPGAAILDVGCGSGRHAIELARRGYIVTGLDVSQGMLQEAQKKAGKANVSITWIHGDAAGFSLDRQFDGVIGLCEGAMGLLGSQDDPIGQPLAILQNIAAALKPQAKCLFTVLNGFALIRKYSQSEVEQGRFDPLALAERSEVASPGSYAVTPLRERGFVPTELVLLFRLAGLHVLNIWGGTAGNWGKRTIDLDEIEIMALAQKP